MPNEFEPSIPELIKAIKGFTETKFKFVPRHEVDRGVGLVADVVTMDDMLAATSRDNESDDYADEWNHILPEIEPHIAEPLAVILNGLPLVLNNLTSHKILLARCQEAAAAISKLVEVAHCVKQCAEFGDWCRCGVKPAKNTAIAVRKRFASRS